MTILLSILTLTVLLAPQEQRRDPSAQLTGIEKTEHFEIRFRPNSRAEASVDRVVALVEGDLQHILKELGLKTFRHTIQLFLYDDVAELQKVTGVPSGGHSIPLESHVPCDNDQTRVHELVHVVAEKFSERGSEPRNLFFAEGLANAVLRFVHGVPVHAVAAFYKQRGELPPLTEIHSIPDFYKWLQSRPGFNGYDVAGSYMRYLLDTYGPRKVRRYYKGVSAKAAFGTDLPSIEKGWYAMLNKVKLRPGLIALLKERAGGPSAADKNASEAALSTEILGSESDWEALAGAAIAAGDPGQWNKTGESHELLLSGQKSQGDWCVVRLGKEMLEDAIVRCTAEALDADCFGLQIQLGNKCQAMLLKGQGTFIYTDVGGVGHDARAQLGDKPVEIVLRRRGNHASVWIDGKLITEASVEGEPALLGVGCVGGKARFTQIAVRQLK